MRVRGIILVPRCFMISIRYWLPAALAIFRWNWKSALVVLPDFSGPCIRASKACCSSSSACGVARSAAMPAACTSRLRRYSSRSSTSDSRLMVAGPTLKLSGAGMSSTKVPTPWRVSTRPAACMRDNASRTTERLTPSVSISVASVGSLSPRLSVPSRMRWAKRSTSASARRRGC
ncbi:hypothetical protein D3C78_1337660 [compost metagenome]